MLTFEPHLSADKLLLKKEIMQSQRMGLANMPQIGYNTSIKTNDASKGQMAIRRIA